MAAADALTAAAAAEPVLSPDERVPTVIVEDLHIVYRVGAGRGGNAPASMMRLLRRQPRQGVREVHAVRGVSLRAHRGEAVGLVGRNGSGKSTLLRAVAGLLPAASGAVFTEGQPSLLGVNAALMNDLTGDRNIVLGCLAMGMTPSQTAEAYDRIIDFAGVDMKFIDLPMNTYSSGMAARLRFAIASAKAHDVLLVDEALATGDAEFRRKSERRIEQMREGASTVFLVSHQHAVVRDTCSRAIWLDQGQVVMDGPAGEVIDAYEAAYR